LWLLLKKRTISPIPYSLPMITRWNSAQMSSTIWNSVKKKMTIFRLFDKFGLMSFRHFEFWSFVVNPSVLHIFVIISRFVNPSETANKKMRSKICYSFLCKWKHYYFFIPSNRDVYLAHKQKNILYWSFLPFFPCLMSEHKTLMLNISHDFYQIILQWQIK
jgi:hypothetical protein